MPESRIEQPPLSEGSPSPSSITLHLSLYHPERWGVALALLATIVFHLVALYPEVSIDAPPLNDNVLHILNVQRFADALSSGQDPTDVWLAPIGLGYPLFHHYQHLAYLIPGVVVALSREAITAGVALRWTLYLLLALYPLALYWSSRRLGLDLLQSVLASVLGPLIATSGLYGLEAGSYTWSGYGLYTQTWAMLLLPMALAQGHWAIRTGRGFALAVFLTAATVLCHLVYGYILVASLAIIVVLEAFRDRSARQDASHKPSAHGLGSLLARYLILGVMVALVISYFLVPFLRDHAYMNRSVWEDSGKYDSYGLPWVVGTLVGGNMFDAGRFPGLTLLAASGIGCCIWHWREERYRLLAVLGAFWVLVYGGRPTWGALLNLLPLSRDLQFHRLIAGVHLVGVFLIGIGLAWPWSLALSRRSRAYILAPAALTLFTVIPVLRERVATYRQNGAWMAQTAAAVSVERADLDTLFATLRELPPGRVYAGLPAKWGKDLKVGAVPLYALFTNAGFDMLGYLYHGLSLNGDIQVLFHDGLYEQYALFNVRYVVVPGDWTVPSYYTALRDVGRFRLYSIETSGYFDLVDSDLVYVGASRDWYGAASRWLGSSMMAARQHPAIHLISARRAPPGALSLTEAARGINWPETASAAPRGAIETEYAGNGVYGADVRIDRPCVLMLKVTFHPGWRAYVDGNFVDTMMLMPSYVGIRLAPGEHQVRFVYVPSRGRYLWMVVGFLAFAAIAWFERRPRLIQPLMRRARAIRLPRLRCRLGLPAGWGYAGGAMIVALAAALPLLQLKMMSGHDAPEYITRAIEFYEILRSGQWLPRWAPDLNFGYGEPFFVYNPPLIYYLMSLFHAIGFAFVPSQDLACLVVVLVSSAGMYLLGSALAGRRAGFIASCAYVLAPYFLAALYVRQALADFTAFAWLPFAFWGLYRYTRDGRPAYGIIASVSIALLLLSSNPVALISAPLTVAWDCWLAWRVHSLRALLRGLGAVALGLALSAFFWLPALAERGLVQTANLQERYLTEASHFVYPSQFIHSPWGYGLSFTGPTDGMSFALGPIHIAMAVAGVVLLWRMRGAGERARSWIVFLTATLLGSLFFASTLAEWLWRLIPLLQYLAFPWRFLSLAAFLSALLCGIVSNALAERAHAPAGPRAGAITALVVLGLLAVALPKATPERFLDFDEDGHSPSAIAERGIPVSSVGEYAPIWVLERPRSPAVGPLEFERGRGTVLASRKTPSRQEYVVEALEDSVVRVNTFYFPGWTLYVNGARQVVGPISPHGTMQFALPMGQHGVKLVFGDTAIRRLARGISALALALALMLPLLVPWRRPERSPSAQAGWHPD